MFLFRRCWMFICGWSLFHWKYALICSGPFDICRSQNICTDHLLSAPHGCKFVAVAFHKASVVEYDVAIRIFIGVGLEISVVKIKLPLRGAKCKYLWQTLCKLVQIYKASSWNLNKVSSLRKACLLKIHEHQTLLKGFTFTNAPSTRHFFPEGE